MAEPIEPTTTPPASSEARARGRLDRDRIVRAAITQADAGGLEALSMRTLAEGLGVAPMALYRHVANKDDLVDAMIDAVFLEVELPTTSTDWATAMRRRAFSLRDALARHRWAVGLMESRANPGPANLRHHDAMLGTLRAAGFDIEGSGHAYSLMDSYIYGFALTKMNLPFESTAEISEVATGMLAPFSPDDYPNLVAFITEQAMQPGYDYAHEFDHGLDAILEALERAHPAR